MRLATAMQKANVINKETLPKKADMASQVAKPNDTVHHFARKHPAFTGSLVWYNAEQLSTTIGRTIAHDRAFGPD